ncbi:hypothetical protein BV20DRAFT_968942 [Pilatotrama ljubarskyi]|nr:hypothetical protein BV20DRAFT_968942 [Pilatotrama ljubarskyi]
MIASVPASFAFVAVLASAASAHIAAFWHSSMYGFNVTDKTFPYDNRPQVPLYNMNFDQWWFHGHLGYPPNEGDFFELKAGGSVTSVLSCDKGATPWYNSSQGGDVGYGSDSPCPGSPTSAYHTTGIDDVKGCALAIAYKSDVNDVKPDDFAIFSVNHTCVWNMYTQFDVPNLPACPEGGCHCAWFWIHSIDSGSEQIYMNGFKCKVVGDVGTQPLGKPAVPRRCGADPDNGLPDPRPGNCTIGAKLPMYWYQNEGNNMPEDTYHAPYYNDLYGFHDGAQHDVFQDGVIASLAGSGAGSAPTSTPTSTLHSSSAAQAPPPTQAPPATSSSPAPAPAPAPSSSHSEPPESPSSTHVESSTFTHPDPTTVASPTASSTPAGPPTFSAEISSSVQVAPVVTLSAPVPTFTKRCKPRPTGSASPAKKRKHARHLSGLRHAH